MRFSRVEKDIVPILIKHKETRCDDMLLYYHYVENKKANILYAFTNPHYRYNKDLSPYETVSRVRRKLQEKYKDLRATAEQIEEKKKTEKEYRQYARGLYK